jgi:hypothetical protein
MKDVIVKFVPNLEVGELHALILIEQDDCSKVVLLCQDRICVAIKDGEVYRPYPNTHALDLFDYINGTM